MNKTKKLGFTLAEVLIVIGIIGVVAALTLPNLNHATGDKETVTRVKKIHAALTEALDRAQAIYGPTNGWYNGISWGSKERAERLAKRITEFMKVSKDCGFAEGCFSNQPLLKVNGSVYDDITNYGQNLSEQNAYTVILADGIALAFTPWTQIRVDIDGPNKGKNQNGNDIFTFDIPDYNDYWSEHEYTEVTPDLEYWSKNTQELAFPGDNYATIWVLQFENLDYLKCDVSFDGPQSCK